MTLKQCFELVKDAGFEGVEVNFVEEGELSARSSPADLRAIGALARQVGIQISGLCSFLFWPYALTHQDPKRREKGLEGGHGDESGRRRFWATRRAGRARRGVHPLDARGGRPCPSRSATAGPKRRSAG